MHHSAFKGQTLDEIYAGKGEGVLIDLAKARDSSWSAWRRGPEEAAHPLDDRRRGFLGSRSTLRLLGPTPLAYFRSTFNWLPRLRRFFRVTRFLVVTYAQTPGPSGLPASIDRAILERAPLSATLAWACCSFHLPQFFEQPGTFNPLPDTSSNLIANPLDESVEDILYVDWACH